MRKLTVKNIGKHEKQRKGLFWSLACLLLLVTSFYIYLINTTARNGVRWGQTELEVTFIGGALSELESQYLSLKQSVTLATAYAKGFEDVKAVRFISTKKVGTVAAVNPRTLTAEP